MTHDLLIRNGTIVDGTGAPGFVGDLAITGGRITGVGKVEGGAKSEMDASDQVVCPGFVDPHTHYDAQISWDSALQGSAEHGVTTVVLGNCGVGVAPCRPSDRGALIEDLINVEGMSADVLHAGIKWEWESFREYIAAVEGRPCAISRAFLVPLAPLRTYVLGTGEASARAATPSETEAIAQHLRDAMDAGASGFSSTSNRSHVGYQGKPLAARLTSRDEYAAYAGVLKAAGRGVIEIAVTNRFATLADDEYELLDFLLTASGRPVTWISLLNDSTRPNGCKEVLEKAAPLLARGSAPQMLIRSMLREFTLKQPYPLNELKVIAERIFNRPAEEQRAAYADPQLRAACRAELEQGRRFTGRTPSVIVCKVANAALRHHETRTIGEIAAERNADPLDTFFDVALEDDLNTLFAYERANNDRQQIADMLRDPRTMIGLSDGGAHVDMLYEAGYPSYLLSHWVREKQVLTLEHAIKRITSEPADFFGFTDRGRLKPGNAADVVVFDPATVGCDERNAFINDLPTGAGRLHANARGISSVLVNGAVIYRDGKPTADRPGQLVSSH
jgi:N-acyl-D-amino-acid deacylase